MNNCKLCGTGTSICPEHQAEIDDLKQKILARFADVREALSKVEVIKFREFLWERRENHESN